ncbi:hypothetical protein CROQUDRAFT_661886 [Cronartium quercuum f. sp. fusiforme G11]|uniref:Mediator of RNA polymerase II transcription subunit 19 n=1 Tax=Cronartium quercuum f. sp. fusiforme G11 TaxID=708437 RepID=A0A9P6NB67_9BASI|nr:hypothetical protein CROQUDRAFT_661886 [Cronartium quercuum f. sp. fusiforme G11]
MMNGTGPSESTGPKRMKMEKSYGHFVADVGGRNSIKKDHQLQNWIMDPNFQESSIRDFLKPFPAETLAQSFTLQPGVLPGFDTSVWVAEEGGPKRKRKKRKQGEMTESGGPIAAAAPALLPPLPNPHPPGPCSSTPISNLKEEDHRKKKRTKLGSNVSYPVPSS